MISEHPLPVLPSRRSAWFSRAGAPTDTAYWVAPRPDRRRWLNAPLLGEGGTAASGRPPRSAHQRRRRIHRHDRSLAASRTCHEPALSPVGAGIVRRCYRCRFGPDASYRADQTRDWIGPDRTVAIRDEFEPVVRCCPSGGLRRGWRLAARVSKPAATGDPQPRGPAPVDAARTGASHQASLPPPRPALSQRRGALLII